MYQYERRCRWRCIFLAFEGTGTKAILHVMFIAQQAGDVHGRIALSTTAGGLRQMKAVLQWSMWHPSVSIARALLSLVFIGLKAVADAEFLLFRAFGDPGVINYEVTGTARANQYRLEPMVHSRATGLRYESADVSLAAHAQLNTSKRLQTKSTGRLLNSRRWEEPRVQPCFHTSRWVEERWCIILCPSSIPSMTSCRSPRWTMCRCAFFVNHSTDSTPIHHRVLKGTHLRRCQPTIPSYSSWHLVNSVRPGIGP